MNPGIDHDDLSAARGIFTGCILGLIKWAVIAFTIWALAHGICNGCILGLIMWAVIIFTIWTLWRWL
jgi:uncharacterized membrane protein